MCTLPNDNAGHIDGMFGDGAVTGWGISPNRFAVQPDLLCLGTVKVVVSGFLKVVMLKAETAIAVFTDNVGLRNGDLQDGQPISLVAMQDMVKNLKQDQVQLFIEKMAGNLFHCTMGVGSVIVSPPGFSCNNKQCISNAFPMRFCVIPTSRNSSEHKTKQKQKEYKQVGCQPMQLYLATLWGTDAHMSQTMWKQSRRWMPFEEQGSQVPCCSTQMYFNLCIGC